MAVPSFIEISDAVRRSAYSVLLKDLRYASF